MVQGPSPGHNRWSPTAAAHPDYWVGQSHATWALTEPDALFASVSVRPSLRFLPLDADRKKETLTCIRTHGNWLNSTNGNDSAIADVSLSYVSRGNWTVLNTWRIRVWQPNKALVSTRSHWRKCPFDLPPRFEIILKQFLF